MEKMSEVLNDYTEVNDSFPKHHLEIIGNRPLRKSWKKDAWGNKYIYSTFENKSRFKLIYSGKDSIFETEDDIFINE